MKSSDTSVFRGAPTFYRALVAEAKAREAGYALASQTHELLWGEDEHAEDALEDLHGRLERGDRTAVLEWYKTHFPVAIDLMPLGWQRREFLNGVLIAYERMLM